MLHLIGNILMFSALAGAVLLVLPILAFATRANPLLGLMDRLSALLAGIVSGIAGIAIWAGLAIAMIQLAVVIMRYVYGINFIWLQETIVWLFGLLFLLTAGWALLKEEHVRVDIFYRDAPPKRKAIVDLAGTYLFLFPVCILILWAAGPYVYRAWDVLERSREASGLPGVFLLKSAIPLFAVLVAMAGFTLASRAVNVLLGRDGETR